MRPRNNLEANLHSWETGTRNVFVSQGAHGHHHILSFLARKCSTRLSEMYSSLFSPLGNVSFFLSDFGIYYLGTLLIFSWKHNELNLNVSFANFFEICSFSSLKCPIFFSNKFTFFDFVI